MGGGAAGYQTVFAPDGYEKHLVIPSMAKEDISWVRHLPEDLNIVLKNYVMDAKGKKVRPGALTVPINKVGLPPSPPPLPLCCHGPGKTDSGNGEMWAARY